MSDSVAVASALIDGRERRVAEVYRIALLVFAAALPLSIFVTETALAVAAVCWVILGAPRWRTPLVAPAVAYAGLSLLSAALSPNPGESLIDCKQLLLLSIFILVPAIGHLRSGQGERLILALFAGATVSACWGFARYAWSAGGLGERARGPFGHYMTFAGVAMLVAVIAGAALALGRGRMRLYGGLLLPLLATAIAISYARNAWLGVLAGLLTVAVLVRPWAAPVVGALAVLALGLAPTAIRERALSITSLEANADRVEMLQVGLLMVREAPFLGVGSNQIPEAYRAYPWARVQPHLHNNVLQIAAERGLPALVAWLWLLGTIAWHAGRRALVDPRSWLAVAGLGALAAIFVAGLFEYSFGNSEVQMTFLLITALAVDEPTPPAL